MLVELKKSALLKSGKGVEEDPRVEGKTFITSKQRGSYQSRCSSYSNVFYKLFQTPQGAIKIRFIGLNGTLCVGQKLMVSRDCMIWRNSLMHYWENKYGDYSLFYRLFKAIFFPSLYHHGSQQQATVIFCLEKHYSC